MSKPIRIAYVVNSFAMGGLERCIARLVNGLNHDEFRTTIICLQDNISASSWLDRGPEPIVTLGKRDGNDLGVVRRLATTLKQHSIDIAHSHNWGTLVETTLARRRARVPVHVHAERGTVGGTVNARGLRNYFRSMIMRWSMERADVLVSNAISVAKRVEDRCGYPARRIKIIANGVESMQSTEPLQARAEIRRSLQIREDVCVFGSVGRLNAVKAFDLAIRAIAQVRVEPLPCLVLVGDGPEFDALRAVAQQHSVADRVHLVGKQDAVGRWLASFDVYLNTSISEGMSQSVVEAMSTGLPLIVTDVGDNASLARSNSDCGIVIDSGSERQLSQAMTLLATDVSQRRLFGLNAEKRFREDFQIARMVSEYRDFYQGLLGKSLSTR